MNKTIGIVTGATGGIGREFTRVLVNEGLDEIWIVARNKDKLVDLKNEYGDRIRTISLDLSKTDNLNKIKELLENEKPIIKYLINNASIAKMGLYKEFSIEEMENTINLNCKTPVILSNICIPFMKKGSSILNIASASAFQPTPYINLYASTKAFERSYSRALNVELAESGIIVTAVLLGLFVHWILKFDLMYSLMVGAIISSTDAAAVIMIIRQNPIQKMVSTILEVESAANDPMAILLTVLMIQILTGGSGNFLFFT